jgi:hypothetical protein
MEKCKTSTLCGFYKNTARRDIKECKEQRYNIQYVITIWRQIHETDSRRLPTVDLHRKVTMLKTFQQKIGKGY